MDRHRLGRRPESTHLVEGEFEAAGGSLENRRPDAMADSAGDTLERQMACARPGRVGDSPC